MTAPATPSPWAVTATAPVRVADVGGWTDTWFGGPGQVCHVAVGPGVTVQARWSEDPRSAPVLLVAPDLPATLRIAPDPVRGWSAPVGDGHPLLEHAVASVLAGLSTPPPHGMVVEIRSAVPPGASLGTSASVVVALIAALRTLVGVPAEPADLAQQAHHVEVDRVGREAGIQDQWAAATGGASLLTIDPYPHGRARPVALSPTTTQALDARLRTVVFGPHDSSAVHREVIGAVVRDGTPDPKALACLRQLSALALQAAEALSHGDLQGWAGVLRASTDTQARLHPGLIGHGHHAAINAARRLGAQGWKVNGAGGDGGSLTVLLPDEGAAAAFEAWVRAQGWAVPTLRVCAGAAVTMG